MSSILEKLSVKPIWWWERHRPYPIREKIWKISSIPTSRESDVSLAILTTPNHSCEVAWCAASLLKALKSPVRLKMVVDGEFDEKDEGRLKEIFPQVSLSYTREYADRFALRYPALHRLSRSHPMGRKLLTILGLQEESDVIYGDDDLLAFSAMPEVEEWIHSRTSRNLYMQDVDLMCAEPSLHQATLQKKLPYAATINVGFMLIRKGSFRGEIAEELLLESAPIRTWFPDTSFLSVLMGDKAGALPREKFVVSPARQFYNEPDLDYSSMSIRHFTQPVRHLMYLKGMPILKKKWGI